MVGSPLPTSANASVLRAQSAVVRVVRWIVCEVSPFYPTPGEAHQQSRASNVSSYAKAYAMPGAFGEVAEKKTGD
ncbi:hypothetical protein [Pseudoalteromonas sp. Of11M-6]|uniref:hypothetical protein n=1 Tax=Pseudoalteromonas sp. Of11M-6 TaxID=2917754 RepID=UPI001EF4C4A4|nr:hypothetical protein [Pseudoalteromonas sp. Of11M-6]MCG7556262.1 hypothetical protein [Pseudoalteromonas sp. Of11M-6]